MATSPLDPRHWVYLDEQRTHEVHAQAEPLGAEFRLVTTEFPAGARDAAEMITDTRDLTSPEALQLALAQLEERLALSGTYFRATVPDMRWSPVAPANAARRVDLRAHELAIPGSPLPNAKMGFHHFHATSGDRDRLLVTLPRVDLAGSRSILAELSFDFPRVEQGDLDVLHTRLASPVLKSIVVKKHVELPDEGFSKLVEPSDYERAFGSGWLERTTQTFRLAASRVLGFGGQEAPAPLPRDDRAHVPAGDIVAALRSPRLESLRLRYLPEGDADLLLSSGELAIRRHFQQRLRRADHRSAFELSMVESALLVEYGLRGDLQALLDEEGMKVLRYAMAR